LNHVVTINVKASFIHPEPLFSMCFQTYDMPKAASISPDGMSALQMYLDHPWEGPATSAGAGSGTGGGGGGNSTKGKIVPQRMAK